MFTFINVQVAYKDMYLLPHKITHYICLQKAQKRRKYEQKKIVSAREKKDPTVRHAVPHRILPTEMKLLLLVLLDKGSG